MIEDRVIFHAAGFFLVLISIVFDMTNAAQEYFNICSNRVLKPIPKESYRHKHHILPKSCGGGDWKWNIVFLTPEEHYRCHELLPIVLKEMGFIDESKKMQKSFNLMSKRNGVKLTACEYGELWRNRAESVNNPMYGRHHSEESKMLMSEKQKGRHLSPQAREKIRRAHLGMKMPPRTPEYCKKRSEIAKRQWQKRREKLMTVS